MIEAVLEIQSYVRDNRRKKNELEKEERELDDKLNCQLMEAKEKSAEWDRLIQENRKNMASADAIDDSTNYLRAVFDNEEWIDDSILDSIRVHHQYLVAKSKELDEKRALLVQHIEKLEVNVVKCNSSLLNMLRHNNEQQNEIVSNLHQEAMLLKMKTPKQEDIDKAADLCRSYEAQISAIVERCSHLKCVTALLSIDIAKQQQMINDAVTVKAELESRRVELQLRHDQSAALLQYQISSQQSLAQQLASEQRCRLQSLEGLQSDYDKKKMELSQLADKATAIRVELSKLEHEVECKEGALELNNSVIAAAERLLLDTPWLNFDLLAELQNRNQAICSEIEKCNNQIKSNHQDIRDFEQEISNHPALLSSELSAVESQINKTLSEIDSLNESLAFTTNTINELNTKRQNAASELSHLWNAEKELRQEVDAADQAGSPHRKFAVELKCSLEGERNMCDAAKAELATIERETDRMRAEYDLLKMQVDQLPSEQEKTMALDMKKRLDDRASNLSMTLSDQIAALKVKLSQEDEIYKAQYSQRAHFFEAEELVYLDHIKQLELEEVSLTQSLMNASTKLEKQNEVESELFDEIAQVHQDPVPVPLKIIKTVKPASRRGRRQNPKRL